MFIQVFRDQDLPKAAGRQGQKVAESILRFFPGFDAFTLPPPSADDEVMRSLNENKGLLQSKFLSGLEQFKSLLRSTLVPKHSYTDGEFVTGEGGDFLTELFYYLFHYHVCPNFLRVSNERVVGGEGARRGETPGARLG